MAYKWNKTNIPGVRYREHPTRKHGIQADRYFTIRYSWSDKQREEGLGWASQGWTAQKANRELAKLKEAHRIGEGAATLNERRNVDLKARKQSARDALTFGELFNEYLPHAQASKSERSWQREAEFFKYFISPVIGDMPLKSISPINLERIKKDMADSGSAPRSIEYMLATVRQVFNYARRNDLFHGDNPVSKLTPLKKPDNRRLRFLSHDEADSLLTALDAKSRDVHDMALLSLHTGMRAGEIFSLTWGDVDLARGILILRDTKSGRSRAAFLTQAAKEMLARRSQGDKDSLVFAPAKGDVKAAGKARFQISKSFKETVHELGFNKHVTDRRKKVVFHTLRHTYASWLVESGVDLYRVKELMGHRTLAMTERYSHLGDNTLQGAVRNLEQAMADNRKENVHEIKR